MRMILSPPMKCFGRLVKTHICSFLSDTMQSAYRFSRSTYDAIAMATKNAVTNQDKENTYFRMPFSDYSSAFNTSIPSGQVLKLPILVRETSMCSWIFDFQSTGVCSQPPSVVLVHPQQCCLAWLDHQL